jgi:spore maturation protein SpmA
VLNWIWLGLILTSIVFAGFTGRMGEVQAALLEGAAQAVTLVIGLVGVMVFMLGIMRIAFDGGLRDWIARALAPLLRRLFPDVPPDHPAMGAMVMNIASNMLGLGNAATPFGLKAMVELSKLNPHPGSASNSMVLFLAINTSAVTLMAPTGTIAVRMAAGSTDPFAIWIPTLIATTCSTAAAIGAFYLFKDLPIFRQREVPGAEAASPEAEEFAALPETPEREPVGALRMALIALVAGAVAVGLIQEGMSLAAELGTGEAIKQLLSDWMFPLLICGLLLIGVAGRVPVYDSMIAGAKEGLEVAVRIVPYLVAILAAVAMLRASGALDFAIGLLAPITTPLGVPAEVLPMAILRPLSGSGAFAVMSETLTSYGADSFIGMVTSTLQGSTETTFYVLAIYLGAAKITDGRHTLLACLTGDFAGFVGAVAACHLFFG